MLSARATQLMAELDHILEDLMPRIEIIAAELGKGPTEDSPILTDQISTIQQISMRYHTFLSRVAQGPDAPLEQNGFSGEPATSIWPDLLGKAYHMRNVFNLWASLHNQLQQQRHSKRQKLYPARPKIHTPFASQSNIQDDIFRTLHSALNQIPQSEEGLEQRAHADIPLSQSTFVSDIHAALRVTRAQRLGRPARFLDVGCGGGLKVISAAQCFYPSEGFDLDVGYVKLGQSFVESAGMPADSVFEANALTFERYSDYDVIYFYKPINDADLLHQMEERIASTARPGTILIAPYREFEDQFKALGCAHIAGHIYITQTKPAAANALRRQAEYIGTAKLQPPSFIPTIWDPIINALQANGFG